jgi:hypothetical protein
MILDSYSKSNLNRKVAGRPLPIPGADEPKKEDGCSKITALVRLLIK